MRRHELAAVDTKWNDWALSDQRVPKWLKKGTRVCTTELENMCGVVDRIVLDSKRSPRAAFVIFDEDGETSAVKPHRLYPELVNRPKSNRPQPSQGAAEPKHYWEEDRRGDPILLILPAIALVGFLALLFGKESVAS